MREGSDQVGASALLVSQMRQVVKQDEEAEKLSVARVEGALPEQVVVFTPSHPERDLRLLFVRWILIDAVHRFADL